MNLSFNSFCKEEKIFLFTCEIVRMLWVPLAEYMFANPAMVFKAREKLPFQLEKFREIS